jgi:hypothetical protein
MATPTAQQIRTEIDVDSKALGYATLKVQTNGPEAVAARMNEAGASAETLFKSWVDTYELIAEIVYSEYSGWTAAQRALVDNSPFFRQTRVKTGLPNLRTTLAAIIPTGASRTAMVAFASRSASRAEALWGEGVRVSATQVADALAI